ncbi:MAG: RecX family transcriptional regulator [Anaerolineaceae bacterium]|nr:RecX family transcriptional regulator [Anaerolineaceae bacterium]
MEKKITALKVQKRNPNRVNVYLEGEFAFGLTRIVAAWLSVGQTLSDAQIQALQTQDTDEVAYLAAVRLLSYRARSETEIRTRLIKKGFAEAVIESVLERLRQAHLLDDTQFAQAWVENQSNFRPRGRKALTLELRQKGIDENTIDQALEQANDEESLAFQAAEKHARRWAGLEWQEFRLKLSRFLARRGFSYGTTIPVVRRIWEELRPSGDTSQAGNANETDEEEAGWIT